MDLFQPWEPYTKGIFRLLKEQKNANEYAILVTTKEGQNRITEALKIKKDLEKAGKKAKVALVAVMRKMIVILNAMVKTKTKWRCNA